MYHDTGDSIAVLSSFPFLENLRKVMKEVLGDKVQTVEQIVDVPSSTDSEGHSWGEPAHYTSMNFRSRWWAQRSHSQDTVSATIRWSCQNYFPGANLDQSCRQVSSSVPAAAVCAAAAPVVELSRECGELRRTNSWPVRDFCNLCTTPTMTVTGVVLDRDGIPGVLQQPQLRNKAPLHYCLRRVRHASANVWILRASASGWSHRANARRGTRCICSTWARHDSVSDRVFRSSANVWPHRASARCVIQCSCSSCVRHAGSNDWVHRGNASGRVALNHWIRRGVVMPTPAVTHRIPATVV